MSVCPSVRLSVRMSAVISEILKATILGLSEQILEILKQLVSQLKQFVGSVSHAHSNAHKPPKPVAPTCGPTKLCHAHANAHNALIHILRSWVGTALQTRFAACIFSSPLWTP